MNEQLLTTYSFFATLTENNTNLYSAVYVPICKRALSMYAKTHNSGTDNDIKEVIVKEYGIDVPIVVVRNLIKSIERTLSRRDKKSYEFKIYEDHNSFSFTFKSFLFSALEVQYENEQRTSNALQEAFIEFAKSEGKSIDDIPAFSEFIQKYKNKISSFLSGKQKKMIDVSEPSLMTHVHFLQKIEKDNVPLYEATKKIFIGSIIASYLESEIDLKTKLSKNISYYLDTHIILELLDLQKEEDTLPIKELINLIHQAGGNVRVLDITIVELKSSLNYAIKRFDKVRPNTTINEACIRTKTDKISLINLCENLEETLIKKFKINIDKIPQKDLENYMATDDAGELGQIWYNKKGAIHDVAAYLYVRSKRRLVNNTVLQKADYWFVTDNKRLSDFNKKRKIYNGIHEIIMPDELTSLLFLQNPKKLTERVSTIALNVLIAQTLDEEYPSIDLINEFGNQISSTLSLSESELATLCIYLSQESTTEIYKLMESSSNNSAQFANDIHTIIEKERNKQRKKDTDFTIKVRENTKLSQDNRDLNKRLINLSEEVKNLQEESKRKAEQEKEKRKKSKRLSRMYVAIIFFLVFFIIFLCVPSSVEWLKKIVLGIISLSGLWVFLNFLLNVCSKLGQFINFI